MDELQTAINRFKEIQRDTYGIPVCTVDLPDNLSEAVDGAVHEVSKNLNVAEKYGIGFELIARCRGTWDMIEKKMTINTSFLPYMIDVLETYQEMKQEGVKLKC